jgi:hypothetical protein
MRGKKGFTSMPFVILSKPLKRKNPSPRRSRTSRKAIHRFDMLTLRQYQRTAVKSAVVHFAFNQRGLLVSPAGSGKTVIAASILKEVKAGRTLIWITPTQETKAQGEKACEAVGLKDVTCACFQGQPDLSGYEWVVVDEGHVSGCDSIQSMLRRIHWQSVSHDCDPDSQRLY